MNRLLRHLRANVVAYLALFVALGGTSYAAATLQAGSVGTRQIRDGAVTPPKLNPGRFGAYVRAWAVIENGNRVIASRPRARIQSWDSFSGAGVVSWGSAISRRCFPLASGGRDFVQVAVLQQGRKSTVNYQAFNQMGQYDSVPVNIFVAVFCPER